MIIGSGAAGLMAALSAAPSCEVVLVTDRAVGRSNTVMAQGGLQLPEGTVESREGFVADMLASARVPVDEQRVRAFAEAVGETVGQLVAWGLALLVDADGEPLRRIAGGMRAPRVVNT
ncbi:MAG: FAD-binding protein, partial [Myxococcota bacterium]